MREQPAQDEKEQDNEQEWVRRAQEGDLVAFNAIVERYQRHAYNLALRMLRDPSAAEDATQEAFFSAYRNIAHFRGGSLRSWLLTIVANGARRDVAPGTSIENFLDSLDLAASQVAVEHNGKILPRSKFSGTFLASGDNIEIVTLVGCG